MALTLVEEVAAVLRDYMDEPDSSFVDGARLVRFLRQGYDEFRSWVSKLDPDIFTADAQIAVNNAFEYDLSSLGPEAVTILGPAPTLPRMVRLVDIFAHDPSTGQPRLLLRGTTSLRELQNVNGDDWYSRYQITGSLLRFDFQTTDSYTIRYVPESAVNWTKTAIGDNEYIDDLANWHDIIALMAYRQYAIMDVSSNQEIERQLGVRMRAFVEYIQDRSEEAASSVHRTWGL